MIWQKVVTPVKTGVQIVYNHWKKLDSGFRRNDGKTNFKTFYEAINSCISDSLLSYGTNGMH